MKLKHSKLQLRRTIKGSVFTSGSCPLWRKAPDRLTLSPTSSSTALWPRSASVKTLIRCVVPWLMEMLLDSFWYREAFGSRRWAPGWWWPRTGSGSGWRFPTVSPSGSGFGWTGLCAKMLQQRVKLQWWPMMEKDVTDSRVLEKLASLAKVLASALGRCGAKSCQRTISRFSYNVNKYRWEFFLFILTSVSFLLACMSERDRGCLRDFTHNNI